MDNVYVEIHNQGTHEHLQEDGTDKICKNQSVDEPSDVFKCYMCKYQESNRFQEHGINQTGQFGYRGVADNPLMGLANPGVQKTGHDG